MIYLLKASYGYLRTGMKRWDDAGALYSTGVWRTPAHSVSQFFVKHIPSRNISRLHYIYRRRLQSWYVLFPSRSL
ncbi:hypothetical protein FQR65_LT03096 [Abscondita terminalis]|nr:hypothetical protein FQR65_LT03096 [Abscondita terminalis]